MTTTVASVATASITVIEAGAEHYEMLTDFYRAVWDPSATVGAVREAWEASADNPVTPGIPPPTFICVRGARVIGYVTTIPLRVRVAGIERVGHWVKGLMVRPEFRNGPVGMLVLREAVRRLDFAAAMVVQDAPRRLFEALGFADLGVLPNAIRILRPARTIRSLELANLPPAVRNGTLGRVLTFVQRRSLVALSAATARVGTTSWLRIAGGGTRGPRRARTSRSAPPLEHLDALWRRSRGSSWIGPSRSGDFLRWRYAPPGSRGEYLWVTTWCGDLLSGVAIVRTPRADGDSRLGGLRVAAIADLLLVPGDRESALTLLAGCEVLAKDLGADVLLCSASHRALAPALRRRAFLPLGGNVHFLVRDPDIPATSLPCLTDWWLQRGDSGADEAF